MSPPPLPPWADEMRRAFRAGSASQFLLYGNVFDLVPAPEAGGDGRYVPLRTFLTEVMFEPFDVVIHYDRGRGVRVRKGGDHFHRFLKAFDAFRGTSWAGLPEVAPEQALNLSGLLPREPHQALELVDRFLRGSRHRTLEAEGGGRAPAPLKVAVLLDYVHFLAPRGEPIHLSGGLSQTLIRLLDWASDPAVTGAPVASVLITEHLTDVHPLLAESPYSAKLAVELPTAAEIGAFVDHLTAGEEGFEAACEVSREALAGKLLGLSRVNVRSLLLRALRGGETITQRYLTRVKKELIEKEAFGRIEFIESRRTLDQVAGHAEAKAWLRQDTELWRRGRLAALPMGYLLCGRIGTGKTFLVECWAGEVGIPVVELRNFREKWVGATEGNLERVFTILRALGQVIVFVDEADQMTGRRGGGEGDAGLSGRVYGMLAKEMSDTANRGKILWVFATSRPDLLEVDLKRQGRLDVHIPLFPPVDPESRRELFAAMAKKVGLDLADGELPDPPDDEQVGGNEMEGILVRALRLYETQPDGGEAADAAMGEGSAGGSAPGTGGEEPAGGSAAGLAEGGPAGGSTPGGDSAGTGRRSLPEIIREVMADFRPSAHVERLQLMDLLAVKEATDSRFLPERFRRLSLAEVNQRIDELRLRLGE